MGLQQRPQLQRRQLLQPQQLPQRQPQQLLLLLLVPVPSVNMKDKNCPSLEIATNIIDVQNNLMVNSKLRFSIVEIGSLIKIKDLVFGQELTMTFVQKSNIFIDSSMKI